MSSSDWFADHGREQLRLVAFALKWVLLGSAAGLLAGSSSWLFLEALNVVTDVRLDNGWLLYLLPVAGLAIGIVYLKVGGRAAEGNNLIIDAVHDAGDWVLHRMAPLVLVGTLTTQLFGGSAGREGTAIQMSGSLNDLLARALGLDTTDRRRLLVAAIAGGFGAVFGVPIAGMVFALEMPAIGEVHYDAIVPALVASIVGDQVVRRLGYDHATIVALPPMSIDPALLGKVALASLAFGVTAAVFAELTHLVRRVTTRIAPWSPLRLVIGGIGVVGMAMVFGREYLGLSLPIAEQALAGVPLGFSVFALKIVFTALTIGSGFPGGEVTPLFVTGAALGSALAGPLGLDPALVASLGFVAVFAGAANTPLACTVMGVELFGNAAMVPLAVACVGSYLFSAHRGIYTSQRIAVTKGGLVGNGAQTLGDWSRARRRLPPPGGGPSESNPPH